MRDVDTLEGNARKNVGKAKQTLGRVTGDTETEAEGMTERVKGTIQEGIGKSKEAIRGVEKGAKK